MTRLCIALLIVGLSTPALADSAVLPAAEFTQGTVSINGVGSNLLPGLDAPATSPVQNLSIDDLSGYATISGSLLPSPSVSASVVDTTAFQVNASIDFSYEVEVIGAPGLLNLNLIATGGATSTVGGDGGAALYLNGLTGAAGTAYNMIYEAGAAGGGQLGNFAQSFNVNTNFLQEANSVFNVQLEAGVGARSGGSSSAFVDPVFSAPIGYTVIVSSGVGNVASVPGPIAGAGFSPLILALMAWFMRRHWRSRV